MQRIALGVEYDGRRYAGWQSQPGVDTLASRLTFALSAVADEDTLEVLAAGRTDAGVHARLQVVHFDSDAQRTPRNWVLGANAHLPADIAVLWARPVPAHFHARYSAVERRYRYFVLAPCARSALAAGRVTAWRRPLDVTRMVEAAAALVGEHDFSAFRAASCQARSPVREVRAVEVRDSAGLIIIDVAANAFLHHMVRNIAGLLLAVGQGDIPAAAAAVLLAGRDRRAAPAMAPPDGLYLWDIHYPAAFELPRAPPANGLSAMLPGHVLV